MESKGFTKDGSVDLHGRPVLASRTGRWKACAFLVGYEAFERMAFYGVASNLVVYLTTQLHEETVASVRSVSNWSGSVWITPILGAYIADTYFGRFWTFTVSSFLYMMGMVLLTMAVSIKSLRPATVNGVHKKATTSQITFFYSALYIMAVGAGGTKPNISTFGADQFDDFDPEERGLKASFFNWWMFSSFLGGLAATLGLVYIQENFGWGLGYGIPTVGLMVSLFIFYIGVPRYRHKVVSNESPVKGMLRVLFAAFKNRRFAVPVDSKELYEIELEQYGVAGKRMVHHTPAFRFLDKAALSQHDANTGHPCTVTQVEETKLVLGMLIVWFTTLIPSTIWAQVNTLFVKQGTTLDRNLGGFEIPPASLSSFITISMLISLPFYDRYLVPFLRRRTKNPRGLTILQRLGIGFSFHIVITLVAVLVEIRRMHVINDQGITNASAIVPMSILWLLPQYLLLGVADVFHAIALIEFFYDQSPDDMRSLGTTFFTSGIGLGNFLNSLLVTVVDNVTKARGGKSWIGNNLNDSHLDYYYCFLLALSTANVALFVWVAMRYKYKAEEEEEAEEVAEGKEMEERVIEASQSPRGFHV